MKLKELLKSKLTQKELSIMPSSFDVVGTIAIFIDFPKQLIKKEKMIAELLLKNYSNIKTVAKKTGFYSGRYRTPKIKIIAGERTKETIHKENNVNIKLNIETCYYSPRLSTERLRIAKLIRKNENILVMFSGVGVYPLVLSRNSKAKEIYGIELNKEAHNYGLENMKINKLNNIILFMGDVKKIVKKIDIKFDRIIMPLPKSSEKFLDSALNVSKKGTIMHFYDFQNENEFNKSKDKIKKHINNFKILKVVKCGQYAPRKYRICVDFKVL